MTEKPSQGLPNPERDYRFIPLIGTTLDSHEIQKRFERMIREIPELKAGYFYETVRFKDREALSVDEFREVCARLSLRAEPLFEWHQDYFDEQFEAIIRIAKERGSHR